MSKILAQNRQTEPISCHYIHCSDRRKIVLIPQARVFITCSF